ncbi:MAG: hypothetical protein SGI98_11450 [Verrucomicrobiota bacterium]|nr:hypothetical protein [Verrucomicrobiota bacterium]
MSPKLFSALFCLTFLFFPAHLQSEEAKEPGSTGIIQPQGAIKFSIPTNHQIFSVVIEDMNGKRVRNLHSMTSPQEFKTGVTTPDGKMELLVSWDGNDDLAKTVAPGQYRAKGLSLPLLSIPYEYSWYNPGTPPWGGYMNSGWLGDHSGPVSLSMSLNPDVLWAGIITSACAEGGDSSIIIDKDGKKIHGYKRSIFDGTVATDFFDDEIWVLTAGKRTDLFKLAVGTGKNKTFQRKTGQVQVIKLLGEGISIAVSKKFAAVCIKPESGTPAYEVQLINKDTGEKIASYPHSEPVQLAYNPAKDEIYASAPDKGVFVINDKTEGNPLTILGLKKPGPMTFDKQGNLSIMDYGPDYQVKVFSPQMGSIRTIGTTGGQKDLAYDSMALHDVRDISTDASGRLWVAENENPRRVVAFSKDGKIVREYIGTTTYSATLMTQHDQDPKRALILNLIYSIDPSKPIDAGRPLRYASTPLKENSPWNKYTGAAIFPRPTFFQSNASGSMKEYILNTERGYLLLFVEKDGDYRPCMAFWTKSAYPERNPYARPEDPEKTIYVWSDLNNNEDIDENELQIIPSTTGRINHLMGFAYPMNQNLELVLGNLLLKPSKFTSEGIPVYDAASAPKLQESESTAEGCYFPVGRHLLSFYDLGIKPREAPKSFFNMGSYLFTDPDGKPVGSYPIAGAGVHASMELPAPSRGNTRGELFIAGMADPGGESGTVVAIQGNYGESYLFTEDGIFITSIFKDARLNPAGMGETVQVGKDLSSITLNQEAFGGWFGKQNDGKIRYMFGRLEAVVCEIQGLDAIKRFDAGLIDSKGEMLKNDKVNYNFFQE